MKKAIILGMMMALAVPAFPASISFIIGSVKIKSPAKWIDAEPGMTLPTGGTIKTMPRSLAVIELDGGSAVKMYPNTLFTLTSEGPAKEGTVLDFAGGSIFTKISKGPGQKKFSVKYQTVVASVRGTLFYFALHKKLIAADDLWICVNEGSVQVKEGVNKSSVMVNQGEGLLIKGGKEVTAPKAYKWTTKLNWNMDPSKGPLAEKRILKGEDFDPVY